MVVMTVVVMVVVVYQWWYTGIEIGSTSGINNKYCRSAINYPAEHASALLFVLVYIFKLRYSTQNSVSFKISSISLWAVELLFQQGGRNKILK